MNKCKYVVYSTGNFWKFKFCASNGTTLFKTVNIYRTPELAIKAIQVIQQLTKEYTRTVFE